MPNRIIKESICFSEDINKLKADEEVFFYRLLVNCDDYGRTDARIPMLKSRLYPLRNMKSSDINRYLVKLAELTPDPLIILYTNNGIPYIQITKWDKHQQIRAKRSKCPAVDDEKSSLLSSDINSNRLIAHVPENPNLNPNLNLNPNPNLNIYVEIINYLNQTLKTKYKTSDKTKSLIDARIKDKFTFEDFKTVIQKKYTDWNGTEWQKFLRPETLFGTKFEGYLNEKEVKKQSQNYFLDLLKEGGLDEQDGNC
jgi:uncharacterized phage protein (TIGR02220 family)